MAKDMLDAICAAEAEAKNSEINAKQTAAQMAAKAKRDAAELISKREKQAQAEAEKQLEKAKADGEAAAVNAAENAQKECDAISAAADKNRGAVIKKAADALLG